jgi:hypothetical protein
MKCRRSTADEHSIWDNSLEIGCRGEYLSEEGLFTGAGVRFTHTHTLSDQITRSVAASP